MSVIPPLDPGEDRYPGLLSGPKATPVEHFTFQAREETLGHRIVETVSDAAHRGSHSQLRATLPEGNRGVLAAMIGVVDHPAWNSLSVGHLKGCQHQGCLQTSIHGPSDNAAGEGIHHDSQVQKSLRRG